MRSRPLQWQPDDLLGDEWLGVAGESGVVRRVDSLTGRQQLAPCVWSTESAAGWDFTAVGDAQQHALPGVLTSNTQQHERTRQ